MSIEEVDIDGAVEAVLTGSERITPPDTDEIRRLTMTIDEPAFRVSKGQQIGAVVTGDKAFGTRPHIRRYSVIDVEPKGEGIGITILVRRCFYIDEINGERYPGVASNYLCDAQPGERISLIGPFRNPFRVPDDTTTNLLMIGTGTGIAPFRTMIQQAYREGKKWQGDVRLFYGAANGMETLYTNDRNSDLGQYYDEVTFKAFNSLPSRPLADEKDALQDAMMSNADVAWELLNRPNTHVYLAGLRKTAEVTDAVFSKHAGSEEAWHEVRKNLIDEDRWMELLYD